MKIILFGDSITDAGRFLSDALPYYTYGFGYARDIASALRWKNCRKYEIINKGNSGNKIVNLYERVQADVWNLKPDVLSVLIGVNDVWHMIAHNTGVDLKRYEKIYRALIEETKERLPNLKIILCEPFFLHGVVTDGLDFDKFSIVKDYADVVRKIAEEYGAAFLPLQKKFETLANKIGAENCLSDGVHPTEIGAKLIADEWLKLFYEKINN